MNLNDVSVVRRNHGGYEVRIKGRAQPWRTPCPNAWSIFDSAKEAWAIFYRYYPTLEPKGGTKRNKLLRALRCAPTVDGMVVLTPETRDAILELFSK